MMIRAGKLRSLNDRQSLWSPGALVSSKVLAPVMGLTALCIVSCVPHSSSTPQVDSNAVPGRRVVESAEWKDGPVEVLNPAAARGLDRHTSPALQGNKNRAKLDALLISRESDSSSDFTIGPGDVLEISVPAMDQLRAVQTRVLENGTTMLPLLGRVGVGGLTEEQLEDVLRQRLRQYMYQPQFSIFVKKYQSREVSVMGALDKPGVYTLANPRETIISMIGKAGGLTDKAGSRVFLIPGGSDGIPSKSASALDGSDPLVEPPQDPPNSSNTLRAAPQRVSAVSRNVRLESTDVRAAYFSNGSDSLSIDVGKASDRKYLKMPARPGDLIIVTQAGQVAVQGWVQTPGAFNITPGMTLLGAVAAAGGELFSSQARILRTDDDGEQITKQANLRQIRNREEPDVAVQAGDVVVVDKSVLGSGPYLVYTLFTKFNTGMYMPVP